MHDNTRRRMTSRQDIERYVLGCLLMDAAAMAEVVDVLKPNNFQSRLGLFRTKRFEGFGVTHANVFECMLRLYPSRSVNIMSVAAELQIEHEVLDYGLLRYMVMDLTDTVGSTVVVWEYAFILVQESIRQAITGWVNKKLDEAQRMVVDLITVDATDPRILRELDFAQIRHRLQQMPDVFDQVDALRTFFTSYGYAEELAELEEMADNINARTRQIREQRFKNNQLNYLRHLAKNCQQPEAAMELVDLALAVINNELVPSVQLRNHINQIGAIA